jgi:quinolinate synthase
LLIRASELIPQGAFAEAQAAFLSPEQGLIERLDAGLRAGNIGVVAHFYMDPELQGVLSSCSWEHIKISDSLLMADHAIAMAEGGVESILVLGVDFMSENVRAMLDASGHEGVPVYRVSREEIGCSLAESAEAQAYGLYLHRASEQERSLHVIYINTSLEVKAKAHARVPTLTCTSSNVVRTVMQAFAQVEGLHVWFGPDTYMGENLQELFEAMEGMSDEEISDVHPAHDRQSVADLRKRFHIFNQGSCVVHQMFGASVVNKVVKDYPDASVAAHLEVPGEMFRLGMERQRDDRGCVGSTSNILTFIGRKVDEAGESGEPQTIQVILGTEAGMITSIVRDVQERLREQELRGECSVGVEIVFPVASEAIAMTTDESLPVVPGVAAGEGCSTAGGCATCPYMKMNSLDALMTLVTGLASGEVEDLGEFEPRKYEERIAGRSAAELGGLPILHMRSFQTSGCLPTALVDHIESGELASA